MSAMIAAPRNSNGSRFPGLATAPAAGAARRRTLPGPAGVLRLDAQAEGGSVAECVNRMLEYAVREGASAIHIEARWGTLVVRYSADGRMCDRFALCTDQAAGVLARIKTLACMDVAEQQVPQAGRFRLSLRREQFEARVSTVPGVDGETAVLHLLPVRPVPLLGFLRSMAAAFGW